MHLPQRRSHVRPPISTFLFLLRVDATYVLDMERAALSRSVKNKNFTEFLNLFVPKLSAIFSQFQVCVSTTQTKQITNLLLLSHFCLKTHDHLTNKRRDRNSETQKKFQNWIFARGKFSLLFPCVRFVAKELTRETEQRKKRVFVNNLDNTRDLVLLWRLTYYLKHDCYFFFSFNQCQTFQQIKIFITENDRVSCLFTK